jgi:hypothetical protein
VYAFMVYTETTFYLPFLLFIWSTAVNMYTVMLYFYVATD